MNQVFKPLLRKCVLVFFDDVLVYSRSKNEHQKHLSEVFELMKENQMHVKFRKCTFSSRKVEYLSHFISKKGIKINPIKVTSISSWPIPTNVKELQSFLESTCYYRKFMVGYALISKPLTNLLKKELLNGVMKHNMHLKLLRLLY